ncbi:MAG TPA: helix-turn-helix domain-containing protein [Chitinophagaceae bacterium]|nr:helix-turn-helix domain-containing protein [Chitinophagaceae bacterium]
MEAITFETLPKAVTQLFDKLTNIERLLSAKENETPADSFLTIQQAAEFLTLSVPTIYGLVSRGEIPVSKKGKRLYFSKAELTEWVKAGRKKTNAEAARDAENYLQNKKKGSAL